MATKKQRYQTGRVDVISMGCSKNLVDSERLMRQLESKGYELHHDDPDVSGEYVVINTCGFIGDAKQESINAILELAELRKAGRIGSLTVMGCLSERYMSELKEEIPEIDNIYGKFDWNNFCDTLPSRNDAQRPMLWERKLTTPSWSAYLKISEGCDRFCAFCAIPLITGRHKSRSEEDIIEEVTHLANEGVREFNVIAQDLSSYGLDLYGRHALADLIDRMADVEGVEWIRLHYAYPADFPYDILDVMRRRDNVCAYLDIALQHISDNVLANMRRHVNKADTLALIKRLRTEVPSIKIRTTLMVGFPGETEDEFEELKEFVKEAKFDRMGAFAYCEEEGTWAERHLPDNVPEDVKQRRLDQIMELQADIYDELNAKMIGSKIKVLIEDVSDGMMTGRTEWDSPEVDFEVLVEHDPEVDVKPGDFVMVEITGAYTYELKGRIVR